ncbi:hypothetical protein ACFSKI_04755 [Pseudogracilibacillus auburnensis]|uniref:Uncharacterized protein n=1 Tax=Pseudogracilibacillus auburnensis TaxID=1494959 RepID=A0A2V3VXC1_9BACI|nr:hypothetical protein [Pseudogracilibacillus auburnensis]MBO1002380.1 hypothetical protein [Pseudogracilibacillus auburnensis]PXW86230.1 hypothetical protein DFR56_10844 [Pseudogracilibacillus auburnensis]
MVTEENFHFCLTIIVLGSIIYVSSFKVDKEMVKVSAGKHTIQHEHLLN